MSLEKRWLRASVAKMTGLICGEANADPPPISLLHRAGARGVAPRALGHPAPQISARAWAVHKRALIFDGHVHALDREFYHGGSMGTRKPDGQWDLPRAREGGVSAFFLSVFIPEEYYPGRSKPNRRFAGSMTRSASCR